MKLLMEPTCQASVRILVIDQFLLKLVTVEIYSNEIKTKSRFDFSNGH
jgi:hypothetical protein